jgi:hypothetical protein
LKSLVAGSGIVLSNDANNLTITANITSLSNVYTQTEVDNLLSTKQDLMALLNDNTKIQLLNNSNVLKSLSAGNNIVLTNDAVNDQFVELAVDLSSYYTQAEVNNLLGFKQNVMALLTDNTKIQLLNNNNVLKSLSAGNNIVLTNDAAYDRFVEIAVDLSSYYTQTEVSNLLNTKQDLIALLNDNTKIQLLNNNNVLKSISAGNNIVLTNDTTSDQSVEIAADLSSYYTQTEVSNLLSAINQAVSAPSVIGVSLLNSDGKIRTIDTELPLMTTLNETIDPNGSVTESRITFRMQQQTSFNFGNSLFDSVTGTMRLAVAPTANDTPTVDNTKMSITPNGDVGVGTTTPQSKFHVVGDVRVDGSITGAINSNVSAPSATGTSLLSSDGKLRTLDTQLPLLMTVNETTDNGIVTESNITLGINTSGMGPTWTTFTSVGYYDIVLSGQPLEEFRVHLEKDTDVSYAKLLLHAIKDDGTPDVMSYNQWRFSEIPWGFNGVTNSFGMNMPYICDKSQPNVIDPVDLTISVSRGSQRNHITCQANWRNISSEGLVRTWASGYFDTTNLHLLRIVFENSAVFRTSHANSLIQRTWQTSNKLQFIVQKKVFFAY